VDFLSIQRRNELVFVEMQNIVRPKLNMRIRFASDLSIIFFICRIEIAVQLGVSDQFESVLILTVNDLFETSFDFNGDALVTLDKSTSHAIRTGRVNRLRERFAVSLACHFDKAELAHA